MLIVVVGDDGSFIDAKEELELDPDLLGEVVAQVVNNDHIGRPLSSLP